MSRIATRLAQIERKAGEMTDCPCRSGIVYSGRVNGEEILPPNIEDWTDDWRCRRCGREYSGVVVLAPIRPGETEPRLEDVQIVVLRPPKGKRA